jgi:hypothetical protein
MNEDIGRHGAWFLRLWVDMRRWVCGMDDSSFLSRKSVDGDGIDGNERSIWGKSDDERDVARCCESPAHSSVSVIVPALLICVGRGIASEREPTSKRLREREMTTNPGHSGRPCFTLLASRP